MRRETWWLMGCCLIAQLSALTSHASGPTPHASDQSNSVKSPLVLVVGCAAPSPEAHIWILSHAGERSIVATPGISETESRDLAKRSTGRDTYHLIGVADFVAADASRRIGERGKLFPPSRTNVTGMLVSGHRVAVKGLYIDARPPRINLTSVTDLGSTCP